MTEDKRRLPRAALVRPADRPPPSTRGWCGNRRRAPERSLARGAETDVKCACVNVAGSAWATFCGGEGAARGCGADEAVRSTAPSSTLGGVGGALCESDKVPCAYCTAQCSNGGLLGDACSHCWSWASSCSARHARSAMKSARGDHEQRGASSAGGERLAQRLLHQRAVPGKHQELFSSTVTDIRDEFVR